MDFTLIRFWPSLQQRAKVILCCIVLLGFASSFTVSAHEPMINTVTGSSQFFLKLLVLILLSILTFSICQNFRLNKALRKEINKRHSITAELKKQSENNQALLLAAGDGIHVLDLQGNLVLANEAFCQHLGYHSCQVTKLNVADWDAQWSREELIGNIPKLRGVNSTFETLHKRSDGKIIPVEINSIGVDIEGEPLLFCSARDISLRKQQEVQLSQAASVFRHSHDGIVIMDKRGYVMDANQSFTRLTGYSMAEILGRVPPLMNNELAEQGWDIKAKLNTTNPWTGETENTGKNGERYITRFTISQIPNVADEQCTYIGVFTDITPLKQYQAQLENMIHYDNLTQLPNRILLMERLNQALRTSKREKNLVAVLYIDLDGFKPINDTYGHAVGDLFLKHVGEAMMAAIRGNDTLARIGGDEFVSVLAGFTEVEIAERIIERVLQAANKVMLWQDAELRASASIGVCLFPADATTAEALIQKADTAMYAAKRAGKNRYHYL